MKNRIELVEPEEKETEDFYIIEPRIWTIFSYDQLEGGLYCWGEIPDVYNLLELVLRTIPIRDDEIITVVENFNYRA